MKIVKQILRLIGSGCDVHVCGGGCHRFISCNGGGSGQGTLLDGILLLTMAKSKEDTNDCENLTRRAVSSQQERCRELMVLYAEAGAAR